MLRISVGKGTYTNSAVETVEPRKPVILQVLPSLVTGGAERGAVDISAALMAAGGTAIVASEGGPMEVELQRAGALHLKLPLASKNPLVMYRNMLRLVRIIKAYNVDIVHARLIPPRAEPDATLSPPFTLPTTSRTRLSAATTRS